MARIRPHEASLADVEAGYGDSVHRLHRNCVELQLNVSRIVGHLGVAAVTADEVEAALDQE